MLLQYRRSKQRICLTLLLAFTLTWLYLSSDSFWLLGTRSHFVRFMNYFGDNPRLHTKQLRQGRHPISTQDIGLIIKSGYSTRERLPTRLQTLGGWDLDDVVVVSDYETEISILDGDGVTAKQVQVHDALARIMTEEWIDPKSRRAKQYREFSEAIKEASASIPIHHDLLTYGWELDIVKHIPALEHAFANLPYKKWYLLTDDDTFIHTPSLLHVLSHLSPTDAHYIGNPIATVESPVRFAHGGSGVLFSNAALSRIFSKPDLIERMKKESLVALYGDKNIAQLALQRGIHVNEGMGVHFSYDPPAQAMIRQDNGCAVLVSFHRVATPSAQLAVHKLLSNIDSPITRWDAWRVFTKGVSDVEMRAREGWNYVGHIELSVPRFKVKSHSDCMALCLEKGRGCMAWEWDSWDGECRVSPWVIVGFKAKGKVSGVNIGEVARSVNECPRS